MGAITRKYQELADCIVTESYVYAATDIAKGEAVKRVKVQRSLWGHRSVSISYFGTGSQGART